MADSIYTVKASTLATGGSLALTMRNFVRKSNGDLAVCYIRSDGTYNQVYVAESTDGGVNWTETALTDYGGSKVRPSLSVDDDDRLYCFYSGKDSAGGATGDNNVRMKPHGGSWSALVVISTYLTSAGCGIGVCDSSGRMWAAVVRHSSQYIYVYYSDDNGATWTDHAGGYLDSIVYYDQQCPVIHICPSDGYPAIMYQKIVGGYRAWRYRKWDGSNWSAAATISETTGNCGQADFIFNSDGKLHVVETYGAGAYAKYSYDGGAFVQLSSNHNCFFPKLVKDVNGDLYCFWYGFSAADGTYRHLQYRKSTDNGVNWAAQVTLTSGNYNNRYPHCVYMEYPRNGALFVNKPKTGYAIFWVDDTDLKVRFSDDLTWDSAVVETKEFSDSGAGSDFLDGAFGGHLYTDLGQGSDVLIDALGGHTYIDNGTGIDSYIINAIKLFKETGAGADIYNKYMTKVFSDVGSGADVFVRIKRISFSDSGAGLDGLTANKIVVILEGGLGADLPLVNKVTTLLESCTGLDDFLLKGEFLFNDYAVGVDVWKVAYPYPRHIKKVVILIRDLK